MTLGLGLGLGWTATATATGRALLPSDGRPGGFARFSFPPPSIFGLFGRLIGHLGKVPLGAAGDGTRPRSAGYLGARGCSALSCRSHAVPFSLDTYHVPRDRSSPRPRLASAISQGLVDLDGSDVGETPGAPELDHRPQLQNLPLAAF